MKDLFENIDLLPFEVREVVEKHSRDDYTLTEIKEFKAELKDFGYTFSYGLDSIPYDLRLIY